MNTINQQFSSSACRWLEGILLERFGYQFVLRKEHLSVVIVCPNSVGSIIFDNLRPEFWTFPCEELPCESWNPQAEGWSAVAGLMLPAPGASGLSMPLIESMEAGYIIHYDILGLTHWMLTRLEEIERNDLDEHGRFPSTSSHAYKYDYLERPIVDEWLHVLGQVIARQWPALRLKRHSFNIKISHDVDSPSHYGFKSPMTLARLIGRDVVKHRKYQSLIIGPVSALTSRNMLYRHDPHNTFEWIMDESERRGLVSAFYFICGRTELGRDADYEIEHPAIQNLMKRIHTRGHEIGLHPSYNTYLNPAALSAEAHRLRRVCSELGIEQKNWGGRMHYLRWRQPLTMHSWVNAGLDYDSTLGYADRPGFRCGTCFDYQAYDPVRSEILKLRIRPLIAMECTVMANRYLGLGAGKQAKEKFEGLKRSVRAVGGGFTLLWHNSQLAEKSERRLYSELIDLD